MTVAQLEHKLSQNPASPIFARLAEEYLSLGRIPEARGLCVSGLEYFPNYPTAYIILAQCFEAEGDYASALQSLSPAREFLPSAPRLHDLQAAYQLKLDRSRVVSAEVSADGAASAPAQFVPENEIPADIRFTIPSGLTETALLGAHLEEQLDAAPGEAVVESSGEESPAEIRTDEVFREGSTEISAFFDRRGVPQAEEPIVPEDSGATMPAEINGGQTGNVVDSPIDLPADKSEEESVMPSQVNDPDLSYRPLSAGNDGRIVSKTLAEIYATQGAITEAILTYQLLKEERPELGEACEARIRELSKLLEKLSF